MPKAGTSVMSDWLAEQIQLHVFHNTPMEAPSDEIELSLHTNGGPALDGTNTDEVTAADYSRYLATTGDPEADPIVASAWTIPALDADGWMLTENDGDYEFTAEAENDWGEVNSVGLWMEDSGATKRLLYVIALTTARTITTGDPVRLTAGSGKVRG